MKARDEDILMLEAQAQIDKEWEEFINQYLADRAEDGIETTTSGRTPGAIQGDGESILPIRGE